MKCKASREQRCQLSRERKCSSSSLTWLIWRGGLPRTELPHDLARHDIKVTDDEPFKERSQRIPPPMVGEVCTHNKEMLEVGEIHPSYSLWCNVVVLVCKKDRGLCFCINFCKLNVRTKKESYPLPQIQEVMRTWLVQGTFLALT